MKATFKGKYSSDNVGSASSTLAFKAGDVTLKASVTDATFVAGPSSKGLVFAFEKPGFFVVDYKFDKKDFGFRFMNRVSVWEKPLDLTYSHSRNENGTTLDGRLAFNSDNKVSANYRLDSGNWKLKYTYVHNGLTTFEPSYDFAKSAWDFALSRSVYDDNVLKATYQTANDTLGLEWSRNSKLNGSFKISATCNMAEEKKKPKLTAESTWDFEI